MGMSRDMVRTAERKQRFWQRIQRERALSGEQFTDHAHEYARILDNKRTHFRHLAKINQMKRIASK